VFGFPFTNREYDLTGATVTVRVDRVIGRGDAETFFELEGGDDSYYLRMSMACCRCGCRAAARTSRFSMSRMILSTTGIGEFGTTLSGKAVVYSTSADDVTWIERHAIATAVAVTAMLVEVGAAIYSGSLPDAVSLFDDVELCVGT
jgi:hypothetical protein